MTFIILSIKITSPKYYFSFSKLAYNCLQNPHEQLAFFFSLRILFCIWQLYSNTIDSLFSIQRWDGEVEVNAKEFNQKIHWENPHMNGWYFFLLILRCWIMFHVLIWYLLTQKLIILWSLNLKGYDSKEKIFTQGERKHHFLLGPTTGNSKEGTLVSHLLNSLHIHCNLSYILCECYTQWFMW